MNSVQETPAHLPGVLVDATIDPRARLLYAIVMFMHQEEPGWWSMDLAEAAGMSVGSIGRWVGVLEKHGLAKKERQKVLGGTRMRYYFRVQSLIADRS